MDHKPTRIAKVIAAAGLCSRREAERWIISGEVTVNGDVITSPALNVTVDDEITVRGKKLVTKTGKPRLFRLHKPKGFVCTHHDPQGRKTIFDLLPPAGLPRLVAVGRLDLTSEGLILLTDTPALADALMKPSKHIPRSYKARIDGFLDDQQIATLAKGVTVDGVRYEGCTVHRLTSEKKSRNNWITITLHEGKNREVRKLMGHLGLQVSRLHRLSYGTVHLGSLPKGGLDELPYSVIAAALKEMQITL